MYFSFYFCKEKRPLCLISRLTGTVVLSAHHRARRRSKGKEQDGEWRGDAGSWCSSDGVLAVCLRRFSPAHSVGVDLRLGFLVLVVVDIVVAPGSGFSSASSSRGSCWCTAEAKDAQLRWPRRWWCAAALEQGELEEREKLQLACFGGGD